MRIPILTYHAANVAGSAYADNDHVALAADLRLIDDLGWRIISLDRVLDLLDSSVDEPATPFLAITFDDGTDLDVRPVDYPGHGRQPGFLPILQDFQTWAGHRQPDLHATSFVIASPAAREAMDRLCLFGGDVMQEMWWKAACDSGLIGIGNHSRDHNHEVAPEAAPDGLPRGRFHAVDNDIRATWQIARAQRYIEDRISPHAVRHFGYPYGDVNAFLRDQWLPANGPALGLRAAWSTEGHAARRGDNCWALPRFVCGHHWRSPAQLKDLLGDAANDD
jgi:peptidoglycan/xylan/chitin deacetylase (PgdA/CDA1 family)